MVRSVFTGEYRHTVDDKGRIAVPARFRAQLDDGAVVSRWIDGCLAIHTQAGWDALSRQDCRSAHHRRVVAPVRPKHLRRRDRGRPRSPGPGAASGIPARGRRASTGEAVVVGCARPRRDLGARDLGGLPPRPWTTRRRSPRPSRASGSDAIEVVIDAPCLRRRGRSTMLAPAPGSLQIDATVGGGGHAERILEATDPDGRLLGLDADGAAIARVEARLRPRFGDRLRPAPGQLPRARARRAPRPASVPSTAASSTSACPSYQLADTDRGFGFRAGGPLDMRFDTSRGVPASELLATLDADRPGGPVPALRRGAVRADGSPGPSSRHGSSAPVETAEELAALVERVGAVARRRDGAASIRRHASSRRSGSRSTRSSRRWPRGWPRRSTCCGPAAAWSVLSYHSLEDRIVKQFFQAERRGCVCPPEAPVCVCGRAPRVRLVTPKGDHPRRGGDRDQPPRPERTAARRGAPRRLGNGCGSTGRSRRTSREEEPP